MSFILGQRRHLADIQRVLGASQKEIDELDPGLKSEVRADRAAAIRTLAEKKVAGFRAKLQETKNDSKIKLPHVSQEGARRRAFAALPAAERTALLETYKRAGTGDLVTYLSDAIATKSIATAEAVRLEFMTRPESERAHFNGTFAELLDSVRDPHARALEIEFTQCVAVADLAEQQLNEFAKGFSDPVSRMTAARALAQAEAMV